MKEWKIWAPTNPVLRWMREDVRDRSRKIILSMLEENPKVEFLDLGCSLGDFTMEMARKIGTSSLYGVDETEYTNSKIPIYMADLDKEIPFGNEKFDIVVASQVIEHLQKPQILLKEIYRVLRPTGNAIISTPNLASWHNILCLVFGFQPPGLSTQWDHRFLLTAKGLLELLEYYNFKIEKVIGIGYYPLFGFPARFACCLDKRHSVDIVVKVRKR